MYRALIVLILASLSDVPSSPLAAFSGMRVIAGPVNVRPGDLNFLAELADSGELDPFIDETYAVERIADASGHKRGNIVIDLWPLPA